MAELLVSASTGTMGSLLSKLATMISDECKALKDVSGDIKELKKELEHMHAFLLDKADVEYPDEQTKLRVRDVRELSYDIEDNIDKFMVHLDRESSPKGRGFKVLVDKCKKLTSDIKIRRQIAKEVKDIKNQIKETSERYARYSTASGCSTRNAVVDTRVLAVFKDASELVGLDGPSDELIRLLKSEEDGDSARQLEVVSIVGFGGLGKTTLANHVYNKLGENFDCRAFVSISRNPDIIKILSSVLSQISNQKNATGPAAEVHEIIKEIRGFLRDKRYFIVVDDIWDVQAWKIMECAFAKSSLGSRIMITTRKMDVAKTCSSPHEDHVYNIKPLSDVDSKKIFFKRIFGCEEKCPSELREVSDGILRKCGGLPLAIIAISSLLATGQRKEDQWERVRRSIGFAFGKSSEIDGMRAILSLSYFDLPHYLRSCLMYLTLFSEDYEIERPRLVHRWIAEGFICGQDEHDLVELGDMYFHELINRSLVQPVDIGYDGKAWGCRVHDTILDFLIHKSAEENFCTTLMSSNQSGLPGVLEAKVHRLSLLNAYASEEQASICPRMDTSHLRSYSIFGQNSKQQLSLISDAHYLRVLDIQSCCTLEDDDLINIGRLYQLRYLNVSNTDITSLPTNIGGLQYLETLNARYCPGLRKLPEAVTRLKQLVRLFLSRGTILPDGIGNLKNLQEFGDYIYVPKCSLNFPQELGELTNMRNLSIWLDMIEGDKAWYMEKLVSSLNKLDACNLRDLSLELNLRRYGGIEGGPEVFVLHGFQRLQSFSFDSGSTGLMVQVEGGAMPTLKDLKLDVHPSSFKSTVLGGFDFGIKHLSCLASITLNINCRGVMSSVVEAAERALKSMVETHTNRPTFLIGRY
ncbi:hypothetical protein BS78_K170200 [Paspalum vaginatum]|uniref:Uncharacterized protein n=1 Tax=Paspalum vaginatum TaxID=158149 RepID=A0A9W8CDV3_9POAL|nr:hypothetical protein BS78_K170200 [Paspalum vaginatum]